MRIILVVWTVALACAVFPCAVDAADRITVAPLEDDTGGAQATPAAPSAWESSKTRMDFTVPESTDGAESGAVPSAPETRSAANRDGMVISYLIDLTRRQNKPCPSGASLPVPPSLVFSEPLCRVAEAMNEGKDFDVALSEQGAYAKRWRTFSSAEPSAQAVVAGLRRTHCEALLEPHTHIGAVRDANGWRIVLAVLGTEPFVEDKPEPEATSEASSPDQESVASPLPLETSPARAASASHAALAPVTDETGTNFGQNDRVATQGQSGAAGPEGATAVVVVGAGAASHGAASVDKPEGKSAVQTTEAPGEASRGVASAAATGEAQQPIVQAAAFGGGADNAEGKNSQEARSLLLLLNELRVKGGACLGKSQPPAAALVFDASLQSAAEKEAATAAANDGFNRAAGKMAGAEAYRGRAAAKLTIKAKSGASVALDAWMMSPTRCETLLAPRFADVGVAYQDGFWVLFLGERANVAARKSKRQR